MASLSDQLEEVRLKAEGTLCSPGTAQEIRIGVSAMVNIPLPPTSKYRHIAAESMLKENSSGNNRKEVRSGLMSNVFQASAMLMETMVANV